MGTLLGADRTIGSPWPLSSQTVELFYEAALRNRAHLSLADHLDDFNTLLGIPIAFNHSATSKTSLSLASTTAFTRSAAVLVENEKWLILILSATQIQPRQAQRRSVGCRKMDLRCPSLVVLKY